MEVIWSRFAERQLDKIFDYYNKRVETDLAKKLVQGIINSSKKLINTPYIGQIETRLKHRKIKYRYLVHKNYKLIYSVEKEQGYIKIADVFDTRQNPIKLERNK